MFSASKLYQSVSICGPSATAKPMSAKIAVTSSVTWETGGSCPGAGPRGQRHVQPLRLQPLIQRGVGQRGLLGRDRRVHLVLQRVQRRARDLPLLRAHLAQFAHLQADLALLADGGDAQLLQRRLVPSPRAILHALARNHPDHGPARCLSSDGSSPTRMADQTRGADMPAIPPALPLTKVRGPSRGYWCADGGQGGSNGTTRTAG
jgi:hypothetical protein